MDTSENWQELESAPKDCSLIEGLTSKGEIKEVHYACDLSGEEQPSFQGFFEKSNDQYFQINIIKWRPLPNK